MSRIRTGPDGRARVADLIGKVRGDLCRAWQHSGRHRRVLLAIDCRDPDVMHWRAYDRLGRCLGQGYELLLRRERRAAAMPPGIGRWEGEPGRPRPG